MIRLTLYTTLGCHLCEELEHHLAILMAKAYVLERIEIADDEVLMARYGIRIPVLVDDQGDELDRGFEAERLAAWLAARGWLRERALEAEPQTTAAPVGAHVRNGRRFLG